MNAVTQAFVPDPRHIALADETAISNAKAALEKAGIEVFVVDSAAEAKAKVLELIPEGSEVMTNASKTLDDTGIAAAINESGKFDALKPKLMAIYGNPDKKREQRKLAAAPDYSLGSVAAVTEDGTLLIASASGSQLGQYTYAAGKVIWVVGTHKIVKDVAEAQQRLNEHVFPLENERALAAYGFNSAILKVLTIHGERPGRLTLILIREPLGF
jgi:hypothetical protein